MRALVALALLLAAPLAAAVVPVPEDTNGDLVPDTWSWWSDLPEWCDSRACARAALGFDVVPDEGGNAQLHRHEGQVLVHDDPCGDPCLLPTVQARTFYDQPAGAQPDITLHGIPDAGAEGEVDLHPSAEPSDVADARVPFRITNTDHNNNTHASASAPHAVGPVAGDAGAASAVLVLLHHDRGLPHTRLAYVAPFVGECVASVACVDLLLNQSYYHHDADDDVIHEQHRVAGDHGAALACGSGCSPYGDVDYDGGVLLEDSFFIIEPPSGVRGDAAAGWEAAPPLLAVPPAQGEASLAFAARDPDRDLDLDEAFVQACGQDRCVGA